MRAPSEEERRVEELRRRIIGLGERSQRKSYYPQLQERIKDLENANRALIESEEKYRSLVENVDIGIFRTSPDQERSIIQANPAMARIFDYDGVEELLAMSPLALYYDVKDRKGILAAIDKGEDLKDKKVRMKRRDGSCIICSLTVTVIRSPDGKIRWFDGVVVDITEKERSNRLIEEDRARLTTILDTLPVGIIITDPTGQVTKINELIRIIWREDIQGLEDFDLRKHKGWRPSGEALKDGEWSLTKALHGETIINEEIEIERGDRTRGTVLASSAPIKDTKGRIIGTVNTVIDISEGKELERELASSKASTEMYFDLLTHDISNYNAAAMGYLQLAEMRLKLDESEKRLIVRPLEELRDSSELIANIWDLQKLEAGREKPEVVDLRKILKGIVEEREHPSERVVTITLKGGGPIRVIASSLIGLIFSNIVDNAILHSTGPLTISIMVQQVFQDAKVYARVDIEDNGPGIPDERKGMIFDRNLMGLTKSVSRGLGLHLVRRLVEHYQGKVWAEDRIPGDHMQGAKFVVLLPAAQDPAGTEKRSRK